MSTDPGVLAAAATRALARQQHHAARALNLIPSENSTSPLARWALATDAGSRYFFNTTGDPHGWAFPAAQHASQAETGLTLPLLRLLTGAAHVNVRPLSGLHAMTLVLSAWGGAPDTAVVTIHPDQGGHYATASLARRLGLRPHLATGPDPHTLDPDLLHHLVATHHPHLVYLDQSHVLFPADIATAAEAIRAADDHTVLYADVSHTLGLVLGGALPNPLTAGAHAFGGSTHKTFPGPQKGIVATNRDDLADTLHRAQYDMVSNHHLAPTCALGLAAADFLAADPATYATDTVAAAQALGQALHKHHLVPEAAERGYTATHQLWLNTNPAGIPAPAAHRRLTAAGIHTNLLTDLPGLTGTPALRLGTAEAVGAGLTVQDMDHVAALIADAVHDRRPAARIAADAADLRAARTSRWQLHRHPDIAPLLTMKESLA
jgi:glycine/serine hydroxymethyltransferase